MKYLGQNFGKNNCFAISVYNACQYKKIKHISLSKIVKLIKRNFEINNRGVELNGIKNDFFYRLGLSMKETNNSHNILNRGGIINFKWEVFHCVFCFFEDRYKIINNKKVKQYTFVNYEVGTGNNPIYLTFNEFKQRLKYNRNEVTKGWCFNG